MKKTSLLFVFLILFCFYGNAAAKPPKPGFGAVLFAGLSLGGDDLLDEAGLVNISDGRQGAGELLYAQAGFIYEFSELPVILQASMGLKINSADFLVISPFGVANGESTLTATPVDLLAFYRWTDIIRIGGGISYHLNPEWELCTPFCSTTKFDDATGITFEVAADLKNKFILGGRLTLIDYETGFGNIDASHIGVHLGLRF